MDKQRSLVVRIALAHHLEGCGSESIMQNKFCSLMSDIGMNTESISEHFRYRNDIFQSDIFVSDIGITDVDVGCRISPTLRSMSMPTYDHYRVRRSNETISLPFPSNILLTTQNLTLQQDVKVQSMVVWVASA
jgi:hypothetical protein